MAKIDVTCVQCGSTNVVKNGQQCGHQRYLCKDCKKQFQLTFTYKARDPKVREKIEAMAHKGSGVRDAARVLGISPNTVVRHFKKSQEGKTGKRGASEQDV